MNKIIQYLDLLSPYRTAGTHPVGKRGKSLHWLPQYLALLLGIIIKPFFDTYIKTQQWDFNGLWQWALAAVIIGITAFPAVYKAAFDPTKPIVLQFFVIFTTGMGWQTLVDFGKHLVKS